MKIDGTRRQDRATELVLSYYAAFNRGDWEGMLAMLSEDVVHDLNQGAREVGREAFAAFLGRMNASYREQLRDIVVLVTQDGLVVGSVGGGAVESAVITQCRELLATGGSTALIDYDMTDAADGRLGMICGGRARLLLESL